jgi:hypothetical protein
MRIDINSGEVVAGDMRCHRILAYTAVGTRCAGRITAKGAAEDFETYEVIVP